MPAVDTRHAAEIIRQIQDLLKIYTPSWNEIDPGTGQPVGLSAALIHIFARFSEIIIQRLNQVPEKNFLAYLDLLGASPIPPLPAQVPLTFSLTAGSAVDARVPAETQVAAPATEEGGAAVVFETQHELWVTAMRLKSVYARDPADDRYADHSAVGKGGVAGGVPIFKGFNPIPHMLYIGHAGLLGFSNLSELVLDIFLEANLTDPDERLLRWEIWDGVKGVPLTDYDDETANLTKSGLVTFTDFPGAIEQSVNTQKCRWLRCVLQTPITPDAGGSDGKVRVDHLPSITDIRIQAKMIRKGLSIESAFANQLAVDLSKDFFPFGEKPKHGDTIYLAHSNAFSQTQTTVTLDITLTNPAPGDNASSLAGTKASDDLELQWELGNGKAWHKIGTSKLTAKTGDITEDTTQALTRSGQVKFTLTSAPGKTAVNDITNYWIRVRIISGNYGEEARYVVDDAPQLIFQIDDQDHDEDLDRGAVSEALKNAFQEKGNILVSAEAAVAVQAAGSRWLLVDNQRDIYPIKKEGGNKLNVYRQGGAFHLIPASFAPPSIQTIKIDYEFTKEPQPPEHLLSYNDFVYRQHPGQPFAPFRKTKDTHPSLYFGLTPLAGGGFSKNKISFYIRPADIWATDVPDNPSPTEAPRLVWDYWNGRFWKKMTLRDQTESLTQAGLVEFLPPSDLATGDEFGTEKIYWLRVRWLAGDFQFTPKVCHVVLNTVMASQAVTVRNETLGSSAGTARQRFRTSRTPILRGQQLEVREPEMPSVEERAQITAEEGPDAVPPLADSSGRRKATWVRWQEVPDFFGSGTRDRHYTLDHLNGDVAFGDGRNGLVPPLGRGNIRMRRYQSGGGVAGNRPPDTVSQLKTTVPYVEKVTNPEAAVGGADAESREALLNRAPRTIRHRHRAVTLEDYEDLAMLASPRVARAKCIPTRNLLTDPLDTGPTIPGMVSVITVPHSSEAKPLPTMALINQVQDYLIANGLPTTEVAVAGPLYISVNVTMEIALEALEGASEVEQAVYQKLDKFLHPLTGGLDGRGWAFGREPHKSDFYALIEALPGVDHIGKLKVEMVEDQTGIKDTRRFLVFSGTHQISLKIAEI